MASPVQARLTVEPDRLLFQRSRLLVMVSALAAADLCALSVAVSLGFQIWSFFNPRIPPINAAMLLAPICTMAAFFLLGLYPGIGLSAVLHIRQVWRSVTLTYLLLTAAMFLSKHWWADSRGGFLIAWLLSLLFAPLGRWFCGKFLSRNPWWGVPVLIIGTGETARNVLRSLRSNPILGYRPVACVSDEMRPQGNCEGFPVVGSLEDACHLANVYSIQYVILAMPDMPREELIWYIGRWSKVFPRILIVPNLAGIASLWTEPRDLGGLLGLEIQQKLLVATNQWIKRALDIVLASAGLVLAAPFLMLSALWIFTISRGPVLYVQEREGKDQKIIGVVKLRTMFLGAEEMLDSHLERDPLARLEWDRFCKLKNDPRILPNVGNFLRKSSLDELPQLWNVLKGEMSLVGPRPFPAYHNERFGAEFRSIRMQVTPGITGLWQVGPRSNGDLDAQATLDNYYIQNWSIWLDLYILVRTIGAVFNQEGSY